MNTAGLYGVQRLQPFAETIFTTITAKASAAQAMNLGQGFPDASGPDAMLKIAQDEIARGNNQYAPLRGLPVLRKAICTQRERDYGQVFDADTEVVATVGATEAIAATVLGLVEPGQEVIVFEPYYDAYSAAIALAGAKRVSVPLIAKDDNWTIDIDAFEKAITPKTALVIVNNPHNPAGSLFDLTEFARVCVKHDLLVMSDEAYEYIVFDGATFKPTATYEGMADRTVTVGSAAKSFNVTGWKTGWALARPPLVDAITRAKQFLTFVGFTPAQPAVAHALLNERAWVRGMVSQMQSQRDELRDVLADCGFGVHSSQGSYFVVADISQFSDDGLAWCLELPEKVGVAAIPVSVFADRPEDWSTKVRFTFCKNPETMAEAYRRLRHHFG